MWFKRTRTHTHTHQRKETKGSRSLTKQKNTEEKKRGKRRFVFETQLTVVDII